MKKDLSKCSDWQLEPYLSRRKLLKSGFVVAVVLIALSLIGLDPLVRPSSVATAKTFKARLGHGLAATTPLNHACVKFAELVKERSGGRLDIGVFPSSQLGSMTEHAEAVRLGTIEMYVAGSPFLEPFAPKMSFINLPGMMRDTDHAYKVMYSFALKEVHEPSLLKVGIRPFGYVSNDFRHFTNNKRPIKTLADLKGLKIRTLPTKSVMDTVAALGASPVPMDFSELFSALQQGVVDGQENPFMIIWSSKFYEVQKYLTLTYHIWDTFIFTVNEKFFQSLDGDLQKIVLEAGREAADSGWKEMDKTNNDCLGKLKDLGMIVTEISRQEVQNAAKPVWSTWLERHGTEGKNLIQRATEIK